METYIRRNHRAALEIVKVETAQYAASSRAVASKTLPRGFLMGYTSERGLVSPLTSTRQAEATSLAPGGGRLHE